MEYVFFMLVLVSALLLAATVAFFFLAAFFPSRLRRVEEVEEGGDLEKGVIIPSAKVDAGGCVRKYGWDEIERLTVDFTAPVIGRGGFSTVYLGKLPDSTAVAVKVHRDSERLHRAFQQELEVLLRIRHRNIVRLVGYCDEKEEGALVFEYIPNGTLQDKLHCDGEGENRGTIDKPLTWSERMSISYNLATSLEYLHENCHPQIIHSDLKPSNILLSTTLQSKLCDFGSAKIGFSSSMTPTLTPRNLRHAIVGSPGYSDPHYLKTGMTSKKSDVYSFGVLLMELVTGVQAFDEEKGGKLLTVEMMGVVDRRLDGEFDENERSVFEDVVRRCVGDQPSLRPSMAEIVAIFREKIAGSISAVHK